MKDKEHSRHNIHHKLLCWAPLSCTWATHKAHHVTHSTSDTQNLEADVSLTQCSMNRQDFLCNCPSCSATLTCSAGSLPVYYDCSSASERNDSFLKSMDQYHLSALNPREKSTSLQQRTISFHYIPLHNSTLRACPNPHQDVGWYYSVFLALFSYFPMYSSHMYF